MRAFLLSLMLLTLTRVAHAQAVDAVLELVSEEPVIFRLKITNITDTPIRFLDIAEGLAECGQFYEVTIEKDGDSYESAGDCFYSPMGWPKEMVLGAKYRYERDIVPAAYVQPGDAYLVPPYQIKVTYRLTDAAKERWAHYADRVDMDFTYEAQLMVEKIPEVR